MYAPVIVLSHFLQAVGTMKRDTRLFPRPSFVISFTLKDFQFVVYFQSQSRFSRSSTLFLIVAIRHLQCSVRRPRGTCHSLTWLPSNGLGCLFSVSIKGVRWVLLKKSDYRKKTDFSKISAVLLKSVKQQYLNYYLLVQWFALKRVQTFKN